MQQLETCNFDYHYGVTVCACYCCTRMGTHAIHVRVTILLKLLQSQEV